mgnify:FL=1
MSGILNNIVGSLQAMIYTLPALLITITLHELAHGYTAYKLGDPTAKSAGRLTLNPIKHIDPMGLLCLFILRFGWAKPVPYNPNYFKNRRKGTFLVSLAGPLTNIILGLISLIAMFLLNSTGTTAYLFFELLFIYNVSFAVFNLIPVPPLDGSKIVASILPGKLEEMFWKVEKYGYVVLLILIFTNVLDYILNPAIEFMMIGMFSLVRLFM